MLKLLRQDPDSHGENESADGLLLSRTPDFLQGLVQGGIVRRLAPKLGERRLIRIGLAMVLPGLVVVGWATSTVPFYFGLALLAIGSALVSPCLSALVSLYTPADRQGEVLGVFRSLGALSRAIAPIIAGLVFWKLGSQWPYYGSALVMLAPLLLSGRLPHPKDHQAAPPSEV